MVRQVENAGLPSFIDKHTFTYLHLIRIIRRLQLMAANDAIYYPIYPSVFTDSYGYKKILARINGADELSWTKSLK